MRKGTIYEPAATSLPDDQPWSTEDLSPVTLAAAVHVDIAVPNFGIQEYMEHAPETMEVFRSGVRFQNGMLMPAEVPGLGVEYDEKAAERFPYEPRYLPVARRLDGSIHDW